jgi:hypothetical protein
MEYAIVCLNRGPRGVRSQHDFHLPMGRDGPI